MLVQMYTEYTIYRDFPSWQLSTPLFGFTPSPHPHMMQTPQPTTYVPSYTTPVWATTLSEEVKALTVSSGKVEQTVDSINMKVTSMEKRLENLETKVMDVETYCAFMSGEFNKQQIDIKGTKEDIILLKNSCSQLEAKTTALEKQKTEMARKLVYHSRIKTTPQITRGL